MRVKHPGYTNYQDRVSWIQELPGYSILDTIITRIQYPGYKNYRDTVSWIQELPGYSIPDTRITRIQISRTLMINMERVTCGLQIHEHNGLL